LSSRNGVIVLQLPGRMAHSLQQHYVSVFGPMKSCCNHAVERCL